MNLTYSSGQCLGSTSINNNLNLDNFVKASRRTDMILDNVARHFREIRNNIDRQYNINDIANTAESVAQLFISVIKTYEQTIQQIGEIHEEEIQELKHNHNTDVQQLQSQINGLKKEMNRLQKELDLHKEKALLRRIKLIVTREKLAFKRIS